MAHKTAGFEGGTYRVRLDERRRPTLPPALLKAAGIDPQPHDLVAQVEGPGRVVLVDPAALLATLQESVAAGMAENEVTGDLADLLVEERSADQSFDRLGM